MTAGEYVRYLERYAEAFDVASRIRYETTVNAVTRDPAGGWSVRATARDGTTSDERFDHRRLEQLIGRDLSAWRQ